MFREGRVRPYVGVGLAVMFVLIGAAVLVWALTPHPAGAGMFFGFAGGWGFFWLFPFFWLLFFLFRPWRWWGPWGWGGYRNGPYGYGRAARDPAVDALRERYARGELTKEQFDQMMKDLSPPEVR